MSKCSKRLKLAIEAIMLVELVSNLGCLAIVGPELDLLHITTNKQILLQILASKQYVLQLDLYSIHQIGFFSLHWPFGIPHEVHQPIENASYIRYVYISIIFGRCQSNLLLQEMTRIMLTCIVPAMTTAKTAANINRD